MKWFHKLFIAIMILIGIGGYVLAMVIIWTHEDKPRIITELKQPLPEQEDELTPCEVHLSVTAGQPSMVVAAVSVVRMTGYANVLYSHGSSTNMSVGKVISVPMTKNHAVVGPQFVPDKEVIRKADKMWTNEICSEHEFMVWKNNGGN